MMELADIKELAFNLDFRKQYPDLEPQFRALDALGGMNCKNCDKRKRDRILRMIETRAQLRTPRAYSSGGTLAIEMFAKAVRLKPVRKFLVSKTGDKGKELEVLIEQQGYFSDSTESLLKDLHSMYNKDESLINGVNQILNQDELRDKLYASNPKCKIFSSENPQELENLVNEFLLGKKLISIQFSGNTAMVMYYLTS